MAEQKKNKIAPKQPKNYFQTWVILALVAVVFGVTFFSGTGDPIEIQEGAFDDMLQRRDIQKIFIVKNLDYVEVTLTSEALKNSKYRDELEKKNKWGVNEVGPH